MEDNSHNSEKKDLQIKKTEERVTESGMSKNEKYFWGAIIVLLLGYVSISLIALYKTDSEVKDREPIVDEKWLELPSKKIRENLSLNQELIKENLNLQIQKINIKIDDEVDM
ncbi:MAG: hypothetical protein RQ763_03985, partial [Sulfurimonas sp.]|uniref:hypothetical protein n=1 Tax=Sulfurimonas sp. TaxID=2022749 RepID=UPI0028CE631B